MNKLIIVGAGGFARETLQCALQSKDNNVNWVISGFISDDLDVLNGIECSYKILGKVHGWQPKADERFVIAIGSTVDKKRIATELAVKGAIFVNVIHKSVTIFPNAKLGCGVILCPNVFVSDNAVIYDHVAINHSSGIGHDAQVGAYTTISSFCDITGNVKVGESVFFGSSVSTIPKINIANDSYVCAGSVVMNNLKPHSRVMGVPAKNFAIKKA